MLDRRFTSALPEFGKVVCASSYDQNSVSLHSNFCCTGFSAPANPASNPSVRNGFAARLLIFRESQPQFQNAAYAAAHTSGGR